MKYGLVTILIALFLTGVDKAQNREQFFDSGNVRIRYVSAGQGTPVILIHGWASSAEQNWAAVIQDLSTDHQVIALDCRGHGRSGKPHNVSQYGVEMVNDVVRLMDHLKIRKAHIAGYSLGEMILLKLLTMHPERVLSAVIAGQGGVRSDTLDKQENPILRYLDQGMPVSEAMTAALPPGEPKPSPTEQSLMKLVFRNNDSKALAAAMRGFNHLLVTNKQLKKNKVPALALYSVEGKTVMPLKDLMANVEVREIREANHLSAPVKPEFRNLIRAFIEKHSASVK